MFTKRLILITFLALCSVFIHQYVFAKILFVDDFETDSLGDEPKKWKVVDDPPGKPAGQIVKDPEDSSNKVLLASIRGDRDGRIYVAGEENWSDIVVQFDWYLAKEGIQHGTVFRYTDRNNHYLFDRRSPAAGNALDFWRRQGGGWTNFARTPMQTDVKTWYTVMLSLKGDTFTAKMKKKEEDTSFSELEVILEGSDSAFKEGYFGTYASEEPDVAYYDNVIIGESEQEVESAALSLQPRGKLSAVWGKIKASR